MSLKLRWIFLLAVPYVVQFSSSTCPDCEAVFKSCTKDGITSCICYSSNDCGEQRYRLKFSNQKDVSPLTCIGSISDCEWLYDLAGSLNAAHEQREYLKLPLCNSAVSIQPCRMDE
jgi:hypothetical protein